MRSSKNWRLQQTIDAAIRDPQPLLRDPLWGHDPPVGEYCHRGNLKDEFKNCRGGLQNM